MKLKIILILVILGLSGLCYWYGQKPQSENNAAHASFVGSPPEQSKPYNIMDYTKPAKP